MRTSPYRMSSIAWVLVLALATVGCSTSKTSEDTTTATDTPAETQTTVAVTVDQAREAGEIARAIEAEPNRASEILSQHGMTAERFDALVLEIAADPRLSETYEEARTGSSG